MHIVEISRPSRELAAAMTEMRIWLDRNRKEPSLFEVTFLPGREVRFRLLFGDAGDASAFAHAFGGQLLTQPETATTLAA